MEKVNLGNMPTGKLYEYAADAYIWKVLRAGGTRGGNYLTSLDDIHEYTETFKKANDGTLMCTWSGRLVNNPNIYGENGLDASGCFSIFSFDMDTSSRFQQQQDLTLASDELQAQVDAQEKEIVKYITESLERQKNKGF